MSTEGNLQVMRRRLKVSLGLDGQKRQQELRLRPTRTSKMRKSKAL